MSQCLVKLLGAGVLVTTDGSVTRCGRVLKHFVKSNGYHAIKISVNGGVSHYYIHRLVAMFHLGNVDGLTVNHINNDRTDNRAVNLEIIPLKRNIQLAIAKPVVSLQGGFGNYYPSLRSAEKDGFDASAICKVLCGKYKHHGGLQWASA